MKTKRTLAILLALVLSLGVLPVLAAESEGITVFVSLEGYNLGHGFYAEPTAVELSADATVMDATIQLLEELGLEFEFNEWGVLERVYGIHPGETTFPEYITVEKGDPAGDGSVGAFDYNSSSGWMFTLNHFMTPVGADSAALVNGDVIRWQFTVEGWGADLGLGFDRGAFSQLYEHADKTELIRGIFMEGALNTEAALEVVINPVATDEDVAEAFAALELELEDLDKEELAALIASGNTRNRETYVPADAEWDPPAWGLFEQALASAVLVYENEIVTPMAVEGAVLRLQRALLELVALDDVTSAWINPFRDVSENDAFYAAVVAVYNRGLMTGTAADTFAPNSAFTYAMAVTVLWRLAGEPSTAAGTGGWYATALAWAVAEGVVPGNVALAQPVTAGWFAARLNVDLAGGANYSGNLTRAAAAQMLAG